ncbi:MAG: hypothetical protein PVI81_00400 [Anaerolineales bacterium]|jgi:hypothetical protein
MRSVIRKNIQIYPATQIEDLYKLIYQAALGSEHAAFDKDYAKEALEREIQELRPSTSSHLTESISPDGTIVRVHLRPYLHSCRDPEKLFEAFHKTALEYKGSLEILHQYVQIVLELNEDGALPCDKLRVLRFIEEIEQAEFPAVHHSRRYKELYRPAYRVIHRAYYPELFTGEQTI